MRHVVMSADISYLRCSHYVFDTYSEFNARELQGAPFASILAMVEGNLDMSPSGGERLRAAAGDIVFIPTNQRYTSVYTGNPRIAYDVLHVSINQLSDFNEMMEYKLQKLNLPNQERIFQMISETIDTADDERTTLAISKFLAVFDEIKDHLQYTPNPRLDAGITPAIRYLKAYYNQHLTNDMLASLCHLSKSRFHVLFKRATGMTPLQYKNELAIQHAISILRSNPTISIEEVSEQCGFSSVTFFRRLFHKKTSLSPREYRKEYLNNN